MSAPKRRSRKFLLVTVAASAAVSLVTLLGGGGTFAEGAKLATLDVGDRASVIFKRLERAVFGEAVPGGTLDPTAIPKYVTPLVIPPVMNMADIDDDSDNGADDHYDIAVRQFKQQILPGGIWNTVNGRNDPYPATPVWSYGPKADKTPDVAPDPSSQFNYPAYTIETISDREVQVRWRNELVKNPDRCNFNRPRRDSDCDYLPHLLPVDQTVHWANPPQECRVGPGRTDCSGNSDQPYTGPVPIVTHVHGAHVEGHSDGYPEAWWLPNAGDIPRSYARQGNLFDDAKGRSSGKDGYVDFEYRNDQPATTLWYHDHSLGMTRLNVYAGPAGFWLIRGGSYDRVRDRRGRTATLPGPAPVAGDAVLDLNVPGSKLRRKIREIPIVIQDRSFNADGSLFYPNNRAFFEELNEPDEAEQFPDTGNLDIDFIPSPNSDIAPIWNPEVFFNTMVVNGVTWPQLEVAPASYRLRLLNGCNSRFLNLALRVVNSDGSLGDEIPFFQIGAEQGFLPKVVRIQTGEATVLPGNGKHPTATPAADPEQALLMGLAERADVIVDFSGLPDGTVIRMTNTAPDSPFGGFGDPPADPATTGQVMQFVVDSKLQVRSDSKTTSPYELNPVAESDQSASGVVITRKLSLNEGGSELVCVEEDANGNLVQVPGSFPPDCAGGGEEFGPKEALLGIVDDAGMGVPLKWTDASGTSTPVSVQLQNGRTVDVPVTENPTEGDTEDWEISNFTQDGHPIHLHLVRFEVIGRRAIGEPASAMRAPEPSETGYKDTVIAYPGEITTVRATFDLAGLYVWHCHIVEHEDNEMMRPYVVSERKWQWRF